MVIDVISYTDTQYAELSEEQLLEVRSAQLKKNKLTETLQKHLLEEKNRLVRNGIFTSEVWALTQKKLQEACETEIAVVREALLFYLRFSAKPTSSETENSPYPLDYALSDEERYAVVRDYYEATYSDAKELYAAFKADTAAMQYLGELYAPLHDYFWMQANR